MQIADALKNLKKYDFIDKLILILMFFYLLIDAVNGLMLRYYSFSISQPYKLLLLFLIILGLCRTRVEKILYFLFWFLFLFFLLFIYSFDQNFDYDPGFIFDNIVFYAKLIVVPLGYIYFKQLNRKNYPGLGRIFHSIIVVNMLVIVINVIAGRFLGFQMYRGGIGSRGFFYSGNEVSLTFVVLALWIIFWAWRKGKAAYAVTGAVLLGLSVLLATKVAIAGIFISLCIIPFLSTGVKMPRLRNMIYVGILAAAGIYMAYRGMVMTGLWDRFLYFYHRVDLVSFLLSSRNIFLASSRDIFMHEYTPLQQLFGVGYDDLIKSVEIDFFDIVMYYGIVGVTVFTLFWLYMLLQSCRVYFRKASDYASLIVFLDLMLVGISFTAGRTMTSAMSGIFIALSNAMLFLNMGEVNQGNEQRDENISHL